jgi:hypothetical protein
MIKVEGKHVEFLIGMMKLLRENFKWEICGFLF